VNLDYAHYYRRWHPETPEHQEEMSAFYWRVLGPHLPTDKAAPVLDVGCGGGYALAALREMGFTRCAGVESDAAQVASCVKKGLSVELAADTVAFLKARAGQFQLLLCLDVIEHVPHDAQLAFTAALAGALATGGTLVFTVPNANSTLAGRWRYIDWTHHCSFTEHSLDLLLHSAGLGDIRVGEVEFLTRPANWWLPFASGARHWWAFRFFRSWRRLEVMAELGPQHGRTVPLSLNLLGVARKP
jgi:SAM-dependent methyltransferase